MCNFSFYSTTHATWPLFNYVSLTRSPCRDHQLKHPVYYLASKLVNSNIPSKYKDQDIIINFNSINLVNPFHSRFLLWILMRMYLTVLTIRLRKWRRLVISIRDFQWCSFLCGVNFVWNTIELTRLRGLNWIQPVNGNETSGSFAIQSAQM